MYAIRHKPTGGYLPQPTGRNGRGGSHLDPHVFDGTTGYGKNRNRRTLKEKLLPRLWAKESDAKNALTHWLKGKVHAHRHYSGYPDYDYDEDTSLEVVTSRIREEMEIVPITITLPD